ncbi:MAG: hypothetical protein ACOH2G_13310 [Ewingella sp.]
MKRSRFTDSQIMDVLNQAKAGALVAELPSMYSFMTALSRDELRRYEMKNPRKCVDFIRFVDLLKV